MTHQIHYLFDGHQQHDISGYLKGDMIVIAKLKATLIVSQAHYHTGIACRSITMLSWHHAVMRCTYPTTYQMISSIT